MIRAKWSIGLTKNNRNTFFKMKIFDRQQLVKGPEIINLKVKGGAFFNCFKSVVDPVLSLFFIVGFLPLWVLIAIFIKLDSAGPIIFSHERVGKDGKKFLLYKFRTMHVDVDPQEESPHSADDKRISRFGRWLRKTSLDEAPQFFNVLKGEMSVVGPRPEMPFIVKNYQDWERVRLRGKPGITGLWQVMRSKDVPLKDDMAYDFYYLQHRSIILDLVILLKTVIIVLKGKGAY